MKTIFTFLSALFFAQAAIGQSDFTNGDFPSVGDTGAYSQASFAGFYDNGVEARTGSNYTWDFTTSDYSISPGQGLYGFVAPIPAQYGSGYPASSNMREESVFADGEALYEKTTDTLFITLIGSPGSSNYRLNPKFPYFVFPMSFNQTQAFGQTEYVDTALTQHAFWHTQTVKYDGYGTVKLPWGNFSDVKRVAVTTRDSNLINGSVTTTSKYFWFQSGGAAPLVRYSSVSLADSVSHLYTILMNRNAQGTTGIAETATSKELSLYPNPATNTLQLGNVPSTATVKVFDVMGKQVISATVNNGAIDVASLANGYYTIAVMDGKMQLLGRGKFVKQ